MCQAIAKCQHCDGDLGFKTGRGWFHVEGGGLVMLRCDGCGWKGAPVPEPKHCPVCGNHDLRDDHTALPVQPAR